MLHTRVLAGFLDGPHLIKKQTFVSKSSFSTRYALKFTQLRGGLFTLSLPQHAHNPGHSTGPSLPPLRAVRW